eukprot:6128050-Pyramimonas_sp.AAC.1
MSTHGGAGVIKAGKAKVVTPRGQRAARAARGAAGPTPTAPPAVTDMVAEDSDGEVSMGELSEEHIRALCTSIVSDQLQALKKDVDSVVAQSVTEAISS